MENMELFEIVKEGAVDAAPFKVEYKDTEEVLASTVRIERTMDEDYEAVSSLLWGDLRNVLTEIMETHGLNTIILHKLPNSVKGERFADDHFSFAVEGDMAVLTARVKFN
jgi:hypothetical protein